MAVNTKQKRPSIFDDGGAQKRGAIAGRNIYIDDKGQTIMYIASTKTGYLLKEKDAKDFNVYHNRFALSIALAMLLISFTKDWRITLIASAVLFAILEYRFRKKWLPSLPQYTNFVPKKKKTFVEGLVAANNKGRCILLAVLYAALGILLLMNGILSNSKLYIIIFDAAVLLGCLYISGQYIIAVTKMN